MATATIPPSQASVAPSGPLVGGLALSAGHLTRSLTRLCVFVLFALPPPNTLSFREKSTNLTRRKWGEGLERGELIPSIPWGGGSACPSPLASLQQEQPRPLAMTVTL